MYLEGKVDVFLESVVHFFSVPKKENVCIHLILKTGFILLILNENN